MLTKEQVLEAIKNGRESKCIDGRDYIRLIDFYPIEEWHYFGFKPKEGVIHSPLQWTKENILIQLELDLKFAFEKSYDQRGISSALMYEVIKMWMWILEDELKNHNNYHSYGVPFLISVAKEFGMEIPGE